MNKRQKREKSARESHREYSKETRVSHTDKSGTPAETR
jgi:hypothetical protein